jgi:hypothetical protein
MTSWPQGFCIGSIVAPLIILLLCCGIFVYLSPSHPTDEEKHEQ